MFRLVSLAYRLLPLPAAYKRAIKDRVYEYLGSLFAGSAAYADWKRLRELALRFPKAAPPAEPTPEQWQRLIEARQRHTPPPPLRGDPYVVVPVYRGRAETLACLYSVLEAAIHTCVVVVDDCSPERGLVARLQELAGAGLFSLQRNRRNRGFALSANAGMELHPERDVVLLNSDTQVFGGWLARLHATAWAEPRIGSVTPLSNNAEICSYPGTLQNNDAKLEVDCATLDQLAAEVNRGRYAESPTAVGFCMYVRRDCLAETGLFDARFGKGYGEENDFCLRAAELGWRHVIAGDVFVRHFGSVSFGRTTHKRRLRAEELIRERFPRYDADVQAFIRHDPVFGLRLNLDAARLRRLAPHRNPNRSLLLVDHGWGGGVAQHVEDLQLQLEREGVNVYFLRPHEDRTRPAVAVSGPEIHGIPNLLAVPTHSKFADLIGMLRILGIDHVHVHSLAGFGAVNVEWLRRLVSELGCAYDMTLHDYMPVCPRLHLSGRHGVYCGEPPVSECEHCVGELGSPFGYQAVWVWRERWREFLAGARRVFCPSRDLMERMARHCPEARYALRPHPERELAIAPIARTPGESSPLCIAVLGAIGEQKGFHLLVDCAEDARRRNLPLRFRVIGFTEDDARMRAAGVEVSGRYELENLGELLAESGCPVAFFASLSPETYSFTFSTALRAQLFPVAFDIGAVAERMREIGWGKLLPLSLAREPERVNDALLALEIAAPPRSLAHGFHGAHYESLVKDYYDSFSSGPALVTPQPLP